MFELLGILGFAPQEKNKAEANEIGGTEKNVL
jgi:hypothetical protein